MKQIIILVLLISMVACGPVDSITEGFKHSQEVGNDLEKAVGKKPFVGFNWSNGTLSNVSVTFSEVPENISINELIELSRSFIAEHFKQEPSKIIISFSVDGSM